MARKPYSEGFRRQAVQPSERTPAATSPGIPADLGLTRNPLQDWGAAHGRASPAGPTATTPGPAPGPAGPPRPAARPGSPAAELAALRARLAALEAENTLLATERDILRQAAKYFAGETRW